MKKLHVVGAAILDRRGERPRCLVARRSATMSTPLVWEFPGGKVEQGESPKQALTREILEELHLEIEVEKYLGRGEAIAGERLIVLDVYSARKIAGEVQPEEHDRVAWITAEEIDDLDWAAADIPLLPALWALLA